MFAHRPCVINVAITILFADALRQQTNTHDSRETSTNLSNAS